jgi:hypothetical protein
MFPLHTPRVAVLVGVTGALLVAAGASAATAANNSTAVAAAAHRQGADQTRVNPDAKALAAFMENVKKYVALHQKLEATLPHLPKEAKPEQIDESQRSLGRLIQQARAGAREGDIFTKESRAVFRRLLYGIFSGPDGKALKASIMDENVGPIKLQINGRYPDKVPVSTVPPQVLEALPKLPEELQYRFIGNRLILFDEHAHIVPDFMDNALPR